MLAIAAAVVTIALFTVPPATATDVTTQSLRQVLRVVRRDELVLAGIAIIVLIGLVGGGVNLLVPLQLKSNGASAGEIGLLFSIASAVYTVVSAIVARLGERSATLRVGGVAALLTGLTIFLVLGSTSTVAAVAFVLLRAPPWSTMDTIIYPLAGAGAHRSALGRGSVMGLVMLGWAAASTVGPLLAGAIADAASDRAAYAVMICFCLLIGLWLLHASRRSSAVHAAVDLDRLYGARDLDSLRGEYEHIASRYDAALVDGMGYRSPDAVASVARHHLAPDGRVLDVGAGTGLLGAALAAAGFSRLDGLDLSPAMLEEAARKGVYRDLREGTLGEPLEFESASVRRCRRGRRAHRPDMPRHGVSTSSFGSPDQAATSCSRCAPTSRRRASARSSRSSRRRAAGSSSSAARSSRRCRQASRRCWSVCSRIASSSLGAEHRSARQPGNASAQALDAASAASRLGVSESSFFV